MRKYKGKIKYNGEWVHGYLIGSDVIVGEIVEWDSEYFCTEFWYKVDPETVGQQIGKKDITGKEIYEGDYDIENGVYYIAQYQDGELGMITKEPGFDPDFDNCVNWHNFTVRGNRCDNPDLLGEVESNEAN